MEERWTDRIEDEKSRDTNRNEVVGNFSARMLNLSVGTGGTEERTAKAAEKNVDLIEQIQRFLQSYMPKRGEEEVTYGD